MYEVFELTGSWLTHDNTPEKGRFISRHRLYGRALSSANRADDRGYRSGRKTKTGIFRDGVLIATTASYPLNWRPTERSHPKT